MLTPNSRIMSFTEALYNKAENYFRQQNAGKYATGAFYLKNAILLITYILVYVFFVFFSQSFGELLLAAFILGICHVFIPVNLSHDAIHGSISPCKWINNWGLYGFEITGSNSYMYSKKHLEAHYNKENGSKTKAIESQGLLLQKHNASRTTNLPFISYLLYAQYMIFARDLILFFSSREAIPAKEFIKLFFFKLLYCIAFIILPFIYMKAPLWQIITALLFMYLIVTVVLVIILLMPTSKMENARMNDNKNAEEKWVIEILEHNVDFSPKSILLNQIAGGANLNVVHYLFHSANHMHYNKLATIIEETANEYGLAYRKQQVKDVFGIHFNYLKNIQSSNN
ncbi:MAG: fatty acid desaturase [Chitinophagaceae bacterium]